MTVKITKEVTSEAADQKAGMTLDELAAFVQEAMRAGFDGSEPIRVRTGYSGQIRRLQVPR